MNIIKIIKTARKWFFNTPERALDEAYRCALMIKAIEDEHFQGNKISEDSAEYGDSVIAFFRKDVDNYIQKIKARLIEFEGSRSVVKFAQTVEQNVIYDPDEALIIDKLNFIDSVINKYIKTPSKNQSVALISLTSEKDKPIFTKDDPNLTEDKSFLNQKKFQPDTVESLSDKTGVLPRSLLKTFSRIRQEIDPESVEAEEEMVKSFRKSRGRTASSVKFLLILVIVPLLVHQFAKITILNTKVIDNFLIKNNQPEFFINRDLEAEALRELKLYKEKLELRQYIRFELKENSAENNTLQSNNETIEEKLKQKAQTIVEEYKKRSINAVSNVFSDMFSLLTFIIILLRSRQEISILKAFIDDLVYGLSDSAKAFLIILFTDIFVGYHSPHGWEIVLEGLAKHLGIPEIREFNFLFIATFPVILDTVLKYWIFRYLNRISPSAVATYRNMNE
jgi:hypothetical protein